MQSLRGQFDKLKDKLDKMSAPKAAPSSNSADLPAKILQKIDQITIPKFTAKSRNDDASSVLTSSANQQRVASLSGEVSTEAAQSNGMTQRKSSLAATASPTRSSLAGFFSSDSHSRTRAMSEGVLRVNGEPRCACEKHAVQLSTQLQAVRANTTSNCEALRRADSAATGLLRVATERSAGLQRIAEELDRFCLEVAQPSGELERFARSIAEIVSLTRFVESNLLELATVSHDLRVAQRRNEVAVNFVKLKAERDAVLAEEAAALRRTFETRRALVAERVADKQREFDARFRADVAQFLAEAQHRSSSSSNNYQSDASVYEELPVTEQEVAHKAELCELASGVGVGVGVDLSCVELPKEDDELRELERFLADSLMDDVAAAETSTPTPTQSEDAS